LTTKFYDSLPAILRNLKSDILFKNLTKKIVINKEYYDVKDFFKVDLRISEKNVIMFVKMKDILNNW
jgi:hypothetical protein